MNLFLKEPTIKEKEEIIKMCHELNDANDIEKFEGASHLKTVLNNSYENS